MFQILEITTLLRLLDAAPEAVHHTIEMGQWTGCVWPGHPEWEAHEACVQIRSLALHYFTMRHPAVEAHGYEIAAQLLASQACPQGGDQHLDIEPRVQEALLWLWALAGGPAVPDTPRIVMPPLHDTDATPVPLPGGDPVAFTATALAMLEALLFTGREAAHQTAATFLRTHADALARRALMLIDAIVQQETARVVEAGIICVDCGTEGLDVWYTGQTWGETLCEACYETRVAQGQAHPPNP
jgi:hypothetical protein